MTFSLYPTPVHKKISRAPRSPSTRARARKELPPRRLTRLDRKNTAFISVQCSLAPSEELLTFITAKSISFERKRSTVAHAQNNMSSQSSSPRRKTTTQAKAEEPEKWFNEYPLEGDPNRPAVVITNLLSKSPRLIGWNDEEIEQIALDANPNVGYGEEEELHIGPKREVVNEVAFGLLGIAAKEVAKQLLQREELHEGRTQRQVNNDAEEDTLESVEKAALDAVSELSADSNNEESSTTMRNTELYQLALRSLLWQRDNYLVGRDYADERSALRRKQKQLLQNHQLDTLVDLPFSRMPFDATALGNLQLVRLGSWFIPSPVVHRSLLPIVVGLPSGPLNEPILRATANLIPMSQNNLDNVMKSRILWFLKDERWRSVIKNSTKGYIANTYRDT